MAETRRGGALAAVVVRLALGTLISLLGLLLIQSPVAAQPLGGLSRLEEAQLRYAEGILAYNELDDDEARAAFRQVIDLAADPGLVRSAWRYLDLMFERRWLQMQGSVRYEYDDNVVLEPNGDVAEFGETADGRVVVDIVGRFLPIRRPAWRLGVEYSLYQSQHFSIDGFDLQTHTLKLLGRYRQGRVTWDGSVGYAITLRDNDSFLDAFRVEARASIRQTQRLFGVVSLLYQRNDFFNQFIADNAEMARNRDGWFVQVGGEQYVRFNQARSVARLGYHFETSRHDGSDWEYDGHRIGIGVRTSLWWDIVFLADGSYTRRNYRHVNSFDAEPLGVRDGNDKRKRQDDRLVGSVGFERKVGYALTVSLQYFHLSNLSNLPFFDFRRNIISLSLSGRY